MKQFLLLIFLVAQTALAQPLEIIELRHRSAEQVLPQLLPFVDRNGAISGVGDKLFVRGAPANLEQIRKLVAALDTPLRRLMISVRQGGSDEAAGSGAAVGGSVVLGGGAPAVRATARVASSEYGTRRTVSQQVQTVEGSRASIMVGQSLVLPFRQIVVSPAGVILAETLVRRELGSGFVALPRLSGETVTVDINPVDAEPGPLPGSANVQQLVTTVSGRLGEWLVLGGSEGAESNRDSSLGGYQAGTRARQRQILLKVELLP